MKAKMIVDFNNPISIQYSNISLKSFKPALDSGFLSEIELVQCITPETILEHHDQYCWKPSLMRADGGTKLLPSSTEKAGMISHWLLMKEQGESDERFLILEHDAYLLLDQLENFGKLIKWIEEKDPCYANIGLYMACYSYSRHCAYWMYSLLHDQQFWINGGPYSVVERLFKNYTKHFLEKRNYLGKDITLIHPWNKCDSLGFGRNIHKFFNFSDPKPIKIPTPVTQVVSKSLQVTQIHHTYSEKLKFEPWLRNKFFYVID